MQEDHHSVETEDLRVLGTGAVVALTGRLGGRGLVVLGQIIFARMLGAGLFGLFSIGWTLLSMVSQISPLGLDRGVVRYGALSTEKGETEREGVIHAALGATLLTGLLVSATVFIYADPIAASVFNKPQLSVVLRGLAPAFGLASLIRVMAAATRITQRMKFGAIIEDLLPPALHLLFFLILINLKHVLQAVIIAAVLSMATATLFGLYLLGRMFPEILRIVRRRTPIIREMLIFSIPTAISGIMAMLIVWVNRLIAGSLLPETEVGVYQAVSQISLLIPILASGLNTILVPMIATLHSQGEIERLNQLFKVSTKWGLYLTVPVSLVLIFFPSDALIALFGTQFASGNLALTPLMLGQIVAIATGSTGWVLIMTGNQNKYLGISTIGFVLSVFISFMTIPHLGILGAALATLAGQLCLNIIGLIVVKRSIGLWAYDRRYLKGVIAAGVGVLSMYILGRMVPTAGMERLILSSFLSLLSTGFVLYILGFDDEDIELYQILKRRITRAF